MQPFEGFDFADFWDQSEYADREYVDVSPHPDILRSVEAELGFVLPAAYICLASYQNGGLPRRTSHRTDEPTSWAEDHVAVTGIYSIGRKMPHSLCGRFGSNFWIAEWGYPKIGVYFADCPSAGHDMLCLDYRFCGPSGEPAVVHVDQERGYKITSVASTFEAFVRGLQNDDAFGIA